MTVASYQLPFKATSPDRVAEVPLKDRTMSTAGARGVQSLSPGPFVHLLANIAASHHARLVKANNREWRLAKSFSEHNEGEERRVQYPGQHLPPFGGTLHQPPIACGLPSGCSSSQPSGTSSPSRT